MKKITTVLLFLLSLTVFAQGPPVVEGTYLPVRGTSVKQVWNTVSGALSIPVSGANIVWDYSNQFPNAVDTFQVKTFHPDSTAMRFHQYYPTATHASFIRTPIPADPTDSLYAFFVIDSGGLHLLGGFNIKQVHDSTAIIHLPGELLVPSTCTYGMTVIDTSKYTFYSNHYSGFPVKVKGTKAREMTGFGYGTLKLPGAIYTNTLLAKQKISTVDSVFVDFNHSGTYVFYTIQVATYYFYSFVRNNTFGSSFLLHLKTNAANTSIVNGYYVLPVDFGSISGIVYDSINGAPTTHGQALLYRENSNFSKNDILDRSTLDINGHYQFDSIPYGEYRVAVRADSMSYPTAFTTYYGDSTDWVSAPSIHTTANSSGNNIHLQYHPIPSGSGIVHGNINYDSQIRNNNPIPGVDIIVKKNPGGIATHEVHTNGLGNFSLSGLDTGHYEMFVDIPGLFMQEGCNFVIANGTIINGFDCTVGRDTIHPVYGIVGVNEVMQKSDNLISVYPNPFSSNTTIKISVSEKADVLLEVYNLLGEKIQTIDQAEKLAGIYSYNFNAKILKHSSGIYILKLSVGGKISVQKIIQQ